MPDLKENLNWRPMTEGDLDAVAAIAVLGFPDHFEGRDCFANRLDLYPRGCFVLAEGSSVKGYLIAYPWQGEAAPPLNSLIEAIPDDAAILYLHDLALHPDVRGGGHTSRIVERLADQAQGDGWPAVALVAVNDAAGFWRRQGFVEQAGTPALTDKLASYGADARYMIRALTV